MNEKRRLIALILLLLLNGGFTQVDWTKFQSTEENFMVSLPREPKQERTKSSGLLGNGHHIYRVESEGITYIVSNSVLEKPRTQPREIKRTFDFARDLLLRLSNGYLLSDKDISLAGFQGREVRVQDRKKMRTLRIYVVGHRVYQLMTTEPMAEQQSANALKFFESFKLIKTPE